MLVAGQTVYLRDPLWAALIVAVYAVRHADISNQPAEGNGGRLRR
jgi:hypothetical protein